MKKGLRAFLAVFLCACAFVGCSSRGNMSSAPSYGGNPDSSPDYVESLPPKDDGFTDISTGTSLPSNDRKLVRTVTMTLETKSFDSLIQTINSEAALQGGYIESSKVGEGYYSGGDARSAEIVVRLPSDKVDTLLDKLHGTANILSESSSTTDVTLNYVDLESKIRSLEGERDALQAMLEQSKDVSTLLQIRSQLTDVLRQIDYYNTSLLVLKSQVEYSTLSLTVYEVVTYTEVKEESMGKQIADGFMKTISDIGYGLKHFVIWFVVNLPYIAIFALIVLAILLIIRRAIRASDAKRARQMESMMRHSGAGQNPNEASPSSNGSEGNRL